MVNYFPNPKTRCPLEHCTNPGQETVWPPDITQGTVPGRHSGDAEGQREKRGEERRETTFEKCHNGKNRIGKGMRGLMEHEKKKKRCMNKSICIRRRGGGGSESEGEREGEGEGTSSNLTLFSTKIVKLEVLIWLPKSCLLAKEAVQFYQDEI